MKIVTPRHRAVAALAALCITSAAADDAPPKELPPEAEAAALRTAEATGRAMYRHDHAAAVATDAVLAHPSVRQDERVRGWLTQEQPDGQIVVTFIDATPAALYRVAVSKDGVAGPVSALASPAALTDYEAGAVTARQAALAARFERCSDRYNTVALPVPDSAHKDWTIYLLPGTTKADVVPLGGTYRIDVQNGGVVSQRGFTKSCIALQKPPNAAGLVVTHLLDATPTEAHVFWSLWARQPFYVVTPPGGSVWVVERGGIRLAERKPAKS